MVEQFVDKFQLGYRELPDHDDFVRRATTEFFVFPYRRTPSRLRWDLRFVALYREPRWRPLFWELAQFYIWDAIQIVGWVLGTLLCLGGIAYFLPWYGSIVLIPISIIVIYYAFLLSTKPGFDRWWELAQRITADCVADEELYRYSVETKIFPLLVSDQPLK